MAGQSHKKISGHRKAKKAVGMRTDEKRRHAESGLGHTIARGEPHVGHTRRQQGAPLVDKKAAPRPDRKRVAGRPL